MEIISVRKRPEYTEQAITYLQNHWGNETSSAFVEDCIRNCMVSDSALPQWYLLMRGEQIIGCAGLVPNDFVSRMDLWPWLCSLYIEEEHRGNHYGRQLVEHIAKEAEALGFENLYLCTQHVSYFEKMGFSFIGYGHHPQGLRSRVYHLPLSPEAKSEAQQSDYGPKSDRFWSKIRSFKGFGQSS